MLFLITGLVSYLQLQHRQGKVLESSSCMTTKVRDWVTEATALSVTKVNLKSIIRKIFKHQYWLVHCLCVSASFPEIHHKVLR